jgi:hypothetical protein
MLEPPRRFPAPWHVEPMPGGYVVRDANGQALAYLYSRDNEAEARRSMPGSRGNAAHDLRHPEIDTASNLSLQGLDQLRQFDA